MSMVAIFQLDCCNNLVVRGRYRGDEMYPPKETHCPFGCNDKKLPSGKNDGHTLVFKDYAVEEILAYKNPELWHTWSRRDRKYEINF